MEPNLLHQPEISVIAALAALAWMIVEPISIFLTFRALWRYWNDDPRSADSLFSAMAWSGFATILRWIWKG